MQELNPLGQPNLTEEPLVVELAMPPKYWQREPDIIWPPDSGHHACTQWIHPMAGLLVLRSVSTVCDGSEWIHISVSRKDRLPSWTEMMKVRDEFLGEDREAYMLAPTKKDYVNLHPHCLHWWTRVDGKRCVANLQDLVRESAI